MSYFTIVVIISSIVLVATEEKKNKEQASGGVDCEPFGYFPQGSPWVTFTRPFPSPMCPQEIGAKVYLITRNNDGLEQVIDPLGNLNHEISTTDFQRGKKTIIIIHGFLASIKSEWMLKMGHAYIQREDVNVLLADWSGGSSNGYFTVAANTRSVAVTLARLVEYLMYKERVEPDMIHCIGHSLGAHICGLMAKALPAKIGKITGLDAAKIGFEYEAKEVRLDADDAKCVVVLHTNSRTGVGYNAPLGDIDFYLNGGMLQKTCIAHMLNLNDPESRILSGGFTIPPVCSHSMATEYYIEVIKDKECDTWGRTSTLKRALTQGVTFGLVHSTPYQEECDVNTCAPLSLDACNFPARGSFYANTAIKSPFCVKDQETTKLMNEKLEIYNTNDEKAPIQ